MTTLLPESPTERPGDGCAGLQQVDFVIFGFDYF